MDAAQESGSDNIRDRRNFRRGSLRGEPFGLGESSMVGANSARHLWSAVSVDPDVGGNPGNHERGRAFLVSSEASDLYWQKTLTADHLFFWLGSIVSNVSWVTS